MNRRKFLQSIGVAATATALPKPSAETQTEIVRTSAGWQEIITEGIGVNGEPYRITCQFVPSSQVLDQLGPDEYGRRIREARGQQ